MTVTTHETHSVNETAPGPDLLEDLLRERYLKMLYWRVGELVRVDDDIPEAGQIADLEVIFSNGKRYFRSRTILDADVIYGLVGDDEISEETAQAALDEILEAGVQLYGFFLEDYEEDETYAKAISTWEHSDGDIIRTAAMGMPEGDYRTLFNHLADFVDKMRISLPLHSPEVQTAALATRMAWELL